MGNNLFGRDIAGIINRVFDSNSGVAPLLSATLFKVTTSTARSGSALTSGRSTTTTQYTCTGFVENFEERQIDGTLVKRGDRKIVLIGDSIEGGTVAPEAKDRVLIENQVYSIIDIFGRDPDAATYELIGRR